MKAATACALGLALSTQLHAQSVENIWDNELANAYHYVDRYEILIDASPQEVWPRLLDLGSWMHQFDMKHEAGPETGEGAVYRLYEGQEFFFKVVSVGLAPRLDWISTVSTKGCGTAILVVSRSSSRIEIAHDILCSGEAIVPAPGSCMRNRESSK